MKKYLVIVLAVMIICANLLAASPALADSNMPTNPFSDIHYQSWAYDAVMYAYQNELFNGISDTEFGPDLSMTRGMLVTVLHRYAGEPAPNGGTAFNDVDPNLWYGTAVQWAAENGIVSGIGDNKFAPEDPITKEQLAAILYRYFEIDPIELLASNATFKDGESISDWAQEALLWATVEGLIIADIDNMLNPKAQATRAEVAFALMKTEHTGNATLYISTRSDAVTNNYTEIGTHTGAPLSFADMVTGVSAELDVVFDITATMQGDDLLLTWGNETQFFSGDPNADYLAWRMMDSLVMTLNKNLQVNNVYFSMENGESFKIIDLQPTLELSADLAYPLSNFFFAHDGAKGEDDMPIDDAALVSEEDKAIALELAWQAATALEHDVVTISFLDEDTANGLPIMRFDARVAENGTLRTYYVYGVTEDGMVYYQDFTQDDIQWVLWQ